MTFGERLKAARSQRGYTQEQLAQQIGVAKSTLTGYEKGNREPDVFKIKKIVEALNVDADYLLGIEKAPSEDCASLDASEFDALFETFHAGLLSLGYLSEGEDITEAEAETLIGITKIINAVFRHRKNSM